LIATNPPDGVKSGIDNEATGKCSCRAIRGDWEQRASQGNSETWEVPRGGQIGGNFRSRYWNRTPSKKAMRETRASIHELTSGRWCCLPITKVVRRRNQFLMGWSNDLRTGYPRCAFRSLNAFVQMRMIQFLSRLSPRPFVPPKGMSWYHLYGKDRQGETTGTDKLVKT
jgi:hypothetical protein